MANDIDEDNVYVDELLTLAGRHDLECLPEAWESVENVARALTTQAEKVEQQATEIERLQTKLDRVESGAMRFRSILDKRLQVYEESDAPDSHLYASEIDLAIKGLRDHVLYILVVDQVVVGNPK